MVTGLPRSGTTLIGSLLAMSGEHYEIWEPFNSIYRRGVEHYWPYVGASSPADKVARYDALIADTVALRHLRGVAGGRRAGTTSLRRLGRVLGTSRVDLRYQALELRNRVRPRPGRIVKDPVGAYLSGHLVDHHGFALVACVRHPAASYLSILQRGWRADDIDGLRAQPDFLADVARPEDLERFDSSTDVAFRFGVRYGMLYRYLLDHVDRSADAGSAVLVHERLVMNPVGEVRRVAEGLGISADGAEDRIIRLMSGKAVAHSSIDLSKVEARDAVAAAFGWRSELEPAVVDAVMAGAGEVAKVVEDLMEA
jgi:hypothetical protein